VTRPICSYEYECNYDSLVVIKGFCAQGLCVAAGYDRHMSKFVSFLPASNTCTDIYNSSAVFAYYFDMNRYDIYDPSFLSIYARGNLAITADCYYSTSSPTKTPTKTPTTNPTISPTATPTSISTFTPTVTPLASRSDCVVSRESKTWFLFCVDSCVDFHPAHFGTMSIKSVIQNLSNGGLNIILTLQEMQVESNFFIVSVTSSSKTLVKKLNLLANETDIVSFIDNYVNGAMAIKLEIFVDFAAEGFLKESDYVVKLEVGERDIIGNEKVLDCVTFVH
jgi:hypothetical protein